MLIFEWVVRKNIDIYVSMVQISGKRSFSLTADYLLDYTIRQRKFRKSSEGKQSIIATLI